MSRKPPVPKSQAQKPEAKKSVLPFIIIGGVLVAVIAAVVLMSQRTNSDDTTQQSTNTTASPTSPRQIAAGAANPYMRGAETARVTLEEFSDFQCPACGGLEPGLRKVIKDYTDRGVKLVFRNYPLPLHRYAFFAAQAAEAAGQQGKFWEMHDTLYDNQKEWSESMEPRVQFDA